MCTISDQCASGSFEDSLERCPINRAARMLGAKWTVLLLREAVQGAQRFDDFETRLGIASNILSCRLKFLGGVGLLEKVPLPGKVRESYVLTPKGQALSTVLVELEVWADRWVKPRGNAADEGACKP
ncbi:HTH-type transcriptional regulator YodB [compost metagenome]